MGNLLSMIEEYSATANFLGNIVAAIIGVVGILFGISSYIQSGRSAARSGFYINLLIYLRRLSAILEEDHVFSCFWDTKVYRNLYTDFILNKDITSRIKKLHVLGKHFHDYLSVANNNLPHKGNKGSTMWKKWYKNIFELSNFLIDLEIASDSNSFEFYRDKDKGDFEQFKECAKCVIAKTIRHLEEEIGLKSKCRCRAIAKCKKLTCIRVKNDKSSC